MKIIKVTYTAKAAYAETNAANIKKVMAGLEALNRPGIHYYVCVGEDGKTFMHTAFFQSDEDQALFNEIPAFKDFRMQLKESGLEVPVKQEMVSMVASSSGIFR